MIVAIKRQEFGGEPYWEEFEFAPRGRMTVSSILDILNYDDDPKTADGKETRRIWWECSCLQKMCGACAMVIDNTPALACATFIDTNNQKRLVIEPLSKFPVVRDLAVDRSSIFNRAREAEVFLGEFGTRNPKEFEDQYDAAKCLKCGLCLEVCPNCVDSEGRFGGAVFANEAYLLASSTADRKQEIKKAYKEHFAAGCSKSLACRTVCPAGTPTLSAMGYMNRL